MDERRKKANETRKRNAAVQRAMREAERNEKEAQLAALRKIRGDPGATPGERLEAVKLIHEIVNL